MGGSRAKHGQRPEPAITRLRASAAVAVVFLAACCSIALIAIVSLSSCTQPESLSTDAANSQIEANSLLPANDNALDGRKPGKPSAGSNDEEDLRLAVSSSKNEKTPKKRVVYITIDDGPSKNTPKFLEVLEKSGVKATWFVLGNSDHPEYLKDIWEAGHQIGLHGQTHDYTTIYASAAAFVKDMTQCANVVKKHAGVTPCIIRFPGGSRNSFNESTFGSIEKAIAKKGWHYFDWNASVADTSPTMRSVDGLLKTAKIHSKGKHSICLLMHDTDSKKSTPEALGKIIKYYKKKGYEFQYLTSSSFGYHL